MVKSVSQMTPWDENGLKIRKCGYLDKPTEHFHRVVHYKPWTFLQPVAKLFLEFGGVLLWKKQTFFFI